MATSLAKLKSTLATTGLSQSNNALYQLINQLLDYVQANTIELAEVVSGGGGSSSGITDLNTDVVATGPGAVAAIIQPNAVTTAKIIDDAVTTLKIINQAVTYPKIQNTVLPDILIGRGTPAGTIQEIELGANLEISGGLLQIIPSGGGGGTGLDHNFLSLTHPDTEPDDPVLGDLVYAAEGPVYVGSYVNAVIMVSLVNDLPLGIYAGYMPGYNGNFITPTSEAYTIIPTPLVASTVADNFLVQEDIDAVILVSLIDDSFGIYGYYNALTPGQFPLGLSPGGGYTPIPIALISPPSPTPVVATGLWKRLPIGTASKVLTVTAGIPSWQSIPIPPYPWTDFTFAAGDFTATGGVGPTWTVAAGDVARWQYQQFPGTAGVGNNVRIALYLKTTSVAGTGPTGLSITLPFNIIGEFAQFISMRENSISVTNVAIYYDEGVSTNTLFIEKVPAGGTFDTTADQTYLSFEISAVLAP